MGNWHYIFAKSQIKQYNLNSTKQHIALVGAGMSAEREVSISSTNSVKAALLSQGYRLTTIDMGPDIANILLAINPDIVFNCLHGTYGEDGCLPGLLNILGIPYTHSGVLASSLAFAKAKSKELFAAHDIKVAKHVIVSKTANLQHDPLVRPYVIKPLAQGSSIGIELVFQDEHFTFANYDFPYGDSVMVEQYIKGREMQVAVLNGKALGALEIKLLQGKRFYDYETKYQPGFAEHLLPAPLAKKLYNMLLTQAEKAYQILGCRGLARVEFIYNKADDDFYILEVNTHPGMTPLSICPEIAAYFGIDFNCLIAEMLKTASVDI